MQPTTTPDVLGTVKEQPRNRMALLPEMDTVQHGVEVEGAEMDSWQIVQAILGCRFGGGRDEAPVLNLPQGVLPGLLDFKSDIEQVPTHPVLVKDNRPKGKLLMFERPRYMDATPPGSLFKGPHSTGTSAKLIEFRRP